MELKELLLETEADKLIELVQKEPGITPERAAARLKLPKNTVEIWADVLSKEGLMAIEYDVRGKMHLYATQKMEEKGAERIKELSGDVRSQAKALKEELKEREKKVKEFKKFMERFEKILNVDLEKARELEEELERIKKSKKSIENELKKLKDEEEQLEKEEKNVVEIINKKAETLKKMEKELEEFERTKQKLEKDLHAVLKLAKILGKKKPSEVAKAIEEVEKSMIEIRKETKKMSQKYFNLQKLVEKLG